MLMSKGFVGVVVIIGGWYPILELKVVSLLVQMVLM